jgi:2-(1,2-epoxy-1,2-dihydrophenyl)acetyl-CoA isomerase
MVMREEFLLASRAIRNDPAVKALVITGAGRAFCAAGDVKAIGEERLSAERGRERLSAHLMSRVGELVQFDRPMNAAVNGSAYEGGLSLALMADFIIATSPRSIRVSATNAGHILNQATAPLDSSVGAACLITLPLEAF